MSDWPKTLPGSLAQGVSGTEPPRDANRETKAFDRAKPAKSAFGADAENPSFDYNPKGSGGGSTS